MKVMQCWDDGVVNDARLAGIFRKRKAKATFNPNPGLSSRNARSPKSWLYNKKFEVFRLSLDEQKDVYKGFKVAGHTMTHPWPTKIAPELLRAELADNKAFIKEFFGQERCGMAYPYGDFNDEVERMVKEAGYLYSRTCKNVDGLLPLSDPFALPSHCHHASPDFWRKYEEVRAIDGVFYFWGHSYELMDDEALWEEFEAKIAKISADPKAEWIDIVDLF